MEKGQGRGNANAKWVLRSVILSLLLICLLQQVEGVQHQVGGTPGWSLPSLNGVNYTAWASAHTFSIGDTLYFNYSSQYHNVVQVTEVNYNECNNASNIETWNDGKTIITLNKSGTSYYICGFPRHCSLGQKVAVLVGSNSTSPTTATTPATASAPGPMSLSATAHLSLSPLFVLCLISIALVAGHA